jgi:2-polyprenyl-6-methoxyphenol hydroxylase-like FAD-dependent oxidoreductase
VTDSHSTVLIAGAGPTGLVLAFWLTRLGVRVRIIDKAAEPGTTSRALAVQARTLEFYRQVGLAQAVVDAGVQVPTINLWARSTRRARVPVGSLGKGLSPYPYPLVYPQDAHERFLIQKLAELGVQVERPSELVRFDQRDDCVRSVIRRRDGSEETYESAYLAGCDGAHSIVREAIGAGFPGGTYSGVFYVADVVGEGPVTNNELHIELDDADFMLVLPMRGAGHLRLIGPAKWDDKRGERELTFDDIGQRVIRNLKLTITAVNWFSTYRVHHRVSSKFRDRRAFLVGDAAHVHSPVGGQGMNTGIADAVNLAWKLAAVMHDESPESLLATYESERIGFARTLVATTDRIFTFITKRGTFARWVRTRLVPRIAPFVFRIPSVRRAMFRVVSQTGINYRESPISVGATGSLRGGDRLPWVVIDADSDNFAPLALLKWQVHVYGDKTAGLADVCMELGLSLHEFAWRADMSRVGLQRDALYLIRPDGYIGLADSAGNPQSLRDYFADIARIKLPSSPPSSQITTPPRERSRT